MFGLIAGLIEGNQRLISTLIRPYFVGNPPLEVFQVASSRQNPGWRVPVSFGRFTNMDYYILDWRRFQEKLNGTLPMDP